MRSKFVKVATTDEMADQPAKCIEVAEGTKRLEQMNVIYRSAAARVFGAAHLRGR